jgi:ABC-type lipoprotein release transport system permease subunit
MTKRWLVLPRLSWRNVRRQWRRSLLTGTAMALGVAALVFSRTLGDGAHEDWIDSGVRMGSGHVAVQDPEYRASRKLEDRISAADLEAASAALEAPDVARYVERVTPRLEVIGLANSPTSAVPVIIMGVDPAAEAEFSQLGVEQRLVEGRYLEPGDRLHVYVGKRLADRLDLELGSRLVLSAQDVTGEIAGQLARVVGIFQTGVPEYDEGIVHIPLSTAQQWMGVEGDITTLAILLNSAWVVPRVLRSVRARVSEATDGVSVLGWRETMPELDAAIKLDDFWGYLFNIVLFVIVALAIVNTILMSVLYRTREFGVLRALGLTKRETATVVFTEGLMLTGLAGLIGLGLGFGLVWLLFRNGLDYSGAIENDFTFSGVVLDTLIIPVFRWVQVVMSLGSIIVIGVSASLYPAYRATRIDVAEAMKFEA